MNDKETKAECKWDKEEQVVVRKRECGARTPPSWTSVKGRD